jgi:3',5'-nucleoside bisphosphate phosphatase
MRRYDLHSHSTRSDGLLAPAAVVARAASRSVDVLALTDHDEVSGLAEAREAAASYGIDFVCGTELSVSWEDLTIHIVGLRRARRMGDALAAAGIPQAYEGALRFVTSERLVSRTHFARFLVGAGYARDVKEVFKRYLVPGKPGHVAQAWASLAQAIDWIHAAGGQAVVAHPGRYKVGAGGMRRLLGEFRDCGGDAIEVLTSAHTPAQYTEYATKCRVFGLAASSGSDYHGPGESSLDLGDLPPLPGGVVPVWKDW